MIVSHQWRDRFLVAFLMLLVIGIPLWIKAYDQQLWVSKAPSDARIIELTGHVEKGWIEGSVQAFEVATLHGKGLDLKHPLIQVKKGDRVVLKLTSSDVIHGFSLKEFGVYIKDGILPGKVTLVSFVADKEGSFTFTCNAICGKNHEKMMGTLVVKS